MRCCGAIATASIHLHLSSLRHKNLHYPTAKNDFHIISRNAYYLQLRLLGRVAIINRARALRCWMRTLDEDSDEEQNSDSLDDVSSDDDELFEPDNNSEFDDDDLDDNDLDEDNLDEAKIEALFAPTTRRVVRDVSLISGDEEVMSSRKGRLY